MKKLIITFFVLIMGFYTTNAQLVFGKDNASSPSVSLEFADTEAKGLLLPWVDNTLSLIEAPNGTLIYDASEKTVKAKHNGGWMDLSVDKTGTTIDPNTGIDGLEIQEDLTENPSAKVSIGNENGTVGILVLEDTDKAMVLPKVNDTDDIINPSPGMMVFVTSTNMLAVFNGSVWSFWKAQE